MGRTKKELNMLSHLGSKETQYEMSYNPALLEKFPNRHPGKWQWVSFICTEFTSLCPLTGQPDFAKIFINYIANKSMVESKALKLYLFSFRNHGDFHEDCVQKICNDLMKLLNPHYLEVIGEFTPRGGIAIFPYASGHDGSSLAKKLYQERLLSYSPGKFTTSLDRLY